MFTIDSGAIPNAPELEKKLNRVHNGGRGATRVKRRKQEQMKRNEKNMVECSNKRQNPETSDLKFA